MFKKFLVFIIAIIALYIPKTVLAGGGPFQFSIEPVGAINPGEQYVVHVTISDAYNKPCKNCPISIKFEQPQDSDYIAQSSDKTDENGKVYAKIISKVPGTRQIYAESNFPSDFYGGYHKSYDVVLNYRGVSASSSPIPTIIPVPAPSVKPVPMPSTYPMPGAPKMIYPQNGQVLDLEGAYMFKVTQVSNASGYLFGLFQDGQMVYENYRDNRVLSSDGEFAVWENNPYHSKFHEGPVEVWVRAYVNNQWTDARIITIYLKPRGSGNYITPKLEPSIKPVKNVPPSIGPSAKIVVVTDSSTSSALQKKIDELQKRLDESQKRQSVLEAQLNMLLGWIKSIFPFFKN